MSFPSLTTKSPTAAAITNLSDIRREIFKTPSTKRIVIRVHTGSLDPQDYRTSASRVVNEVFPDWEYDSRILFLAIEIWGDRAFMAIDINNHDYDFLTAHKTKTVFPVYVLREFRKRKGWALVRWPMEDGLLATKLAYLHNVNGFGVATSFLEDHHTCIVHDNIREFPV